MNVKATQLKAIICGILFCATSFLLSGRLLAQTIIEQQISTLGETSWIVPAGVTEVTIECIGGGGAGGFSSDGANNAAAGGGGGAYAKKTITVTPGDVLTVYVGKGGSGSGSVSGNGENTYVKYNSTVEVLAAGGSGIPNNTYTTPGIGGQASACIGDDTYSGGNGGTGGKSYIISLHGTGGGGAAGGRGGNGGNGGNGGTASAGTAGQVATGSTYSGNGGAGVLATIGIIVRSGNDGSNFGGGGSGGVTGAIGMFDANGGNGGRGLVILTYSNCTATPGAIAVETWVCSGSDTTMVLKSIADATSAAPGSYSWETSTDDGVSWNPITGANAKDYTAESTGWFRRAYTIPGCLTLYSNVVTITHPSDIIPGTIEDNVGKADTTVCHGQNIDLTLISNSIYTIIWQKSTDGGSTWTNISSVNPLPLSLTNVTTEVQVRYLAHYSATCDIPSNNIYIIQPLDLPVVNSLTPIDTCPDLDEYIFVPDITPGSGAITLYHWNGDVAGTTHSTDTLPAYLPERCGHDYHCSLQVEDEYGCKSNVKVGSFTTPSLPSITPITEATAIVDPINCQFVIPDFTDTLNKLYSSDCYFIDTNKQNPVANTPMALGSTIIVKDTIETVCGTKEIFTIEVTAPSILPDLDPSEVTWDDANDTIYLFYGVCDTLYNVTPPTYTSTSPYKDELTLTNNRSSSNSGPILGRLSGNTDTTITWRLSDPCLHSVTYTVHYVVYYPKCGDGVTVTDVDGHTYETVRVGCECWTKTNLRTSTVSDTSFIYQEKPVNDTLFGRLYTWYSTVGLTRDATTAPATTTDPVSNITYIQGVCPTGWAVPTVAAYDNVLAIAGNTYNIKSNNPNTWLSGMGGSNATGFGAVAGGYYTESGFHYINLLGEAYFWTCEGDPVTKKGACCSITHTCPTLLSNSTYTGMGFSVRCVKRSND